MGYTTRFHGQIDIEPPIPWGQIRDCPFLPEISRGYGSGRDLMFVVEETERDTDDGTVIVRSAVAVVSTWEDEARGYHMVEHLQELVDTFPEHDFVGRLDCEGADPGDLWRLTVKDGRAVRVDPRIVWPDDEEAAAELLAAQAWGYDLAVAALRDDSRFEHWWSRHQDGDQAVAYWTPFGRKQLADYLEVTAPTAAEVDPDASAEAEVPSC